jgi:hypothetical protein
MDGPDDPKDDGSTDTNWSQFPVWKGDSVLMPTAGN